MRTTRTLGLLLVAALALQPLPAFADAPLADAALIESLPSHGPLSYQPAFACTPERCGNLRQMEDTSGGGGGEAAGLSTTTWVVIAILALVVLVAASDSGGGDGGYMRP